jgi:aryl-alcohol dehydrogenase-like predicted oxidoreductase/predicted kinase/histidinol phosphatase-like enzyme
MTPSRIAMGCMRLSTERDRDEACAVDVLHAALDEGITLLDTADAYCWDDTERGHNERLIARALAAWEGDRSRVHVATKGGLTRPDGRWEANGRAKHLTAACHDSRRALGVDRIDLYQLHAPDPRVPLATSVRALAALKRKGVIDSIGLCNVTVGQIQEAQRITEIDSIQVELSVWHDGPFFSGVAEYCVTNGLRLLAYRPLGGAGRLNRTVTNPALTAVAKRHAATPFEVALAWLFDLSPLIVPIPGATRVETARSSARAALIVLTDEDRVELDEVFPACRALRTAARADAGPRASDLAPRASGLGLRTSGLGEVVLVMGLPGAGKSTVAEGLTAQGYARLNRDESGGTLRGLLPDLDRALTSGATRIVLDNTYVSRQSRAEVIRTAAAHGFPTRCVWMSTSVEDAQTNAAWRLVSRYGRLPDEAEIKRLRKTDAAAFLPGVQFRYQRELEPPDASEGFSRVDIIPFERRHDPSFVNRAVIVWCDGVLLRSRSGRRVPLTVDDVDVEVMAGESVRRYEEEGWRVLGMSWQPEIAEGTQSVAGAAAIFARMNDLLGTRIEIEFCPHAAGPPRCWCRKPLPGLGVLFVHRHRLDPAQCMYVGDGPQDPGFARRLGFRYADAEDFPKPEDRSPQPAR